MNYLKKYESWLQNSYFDEEARAELALLRDNHAEIKERFHKDLEFGTSGLRGIMGIGSNRMNVYTVRRATQGYANYLKKEFSHIEPGVLFAYDSREFSKRFALEAALVMCANGIKAYVFESLRPAPELSFGVRHLGLSGGVTITASHNPPEYNGYKVYGPDGAQVTSPHDRRIIDEVNKVSWADIITLDTKKAVKDGLLIYVGEEIDEAYYAAILAQSIDKGAITEHGNDMNIVFTPLHGSGNIPVREVLSRAGFKNVHVVAEQEEPDGRFPTVASPNPEDSRVFDLALMLAEKVLADVVIAVDPDADRIGAAVRTNGNYFILNGNMIGVLLTEYMLSNLKQKGALPEDGMIISSVVSTNLTRKIARNFGVEYEEILTGFKYIGEKITRMEKIGTPTYLFGFEESLGYLAGTYTREKDAVLAAYLVCEMAAAYKKRNMTLHDGLIELFDKYGYHLERIKSITLRGIEGANLMKRIMDSYRFESPIFLGTDKVVSISDFSTGLVTDVESGRVEETVLPKANVLYYEAEGGSWMCMRPSGTEPKMKIYFGTCAESMEQCSKKLEIIIEEAMASFEARKNTYE